LDLRGGSINRPKEESWGSSRPGFEESGRKKGRDGSLSKTGRGSGREIWQGVLVSVLRLLAGEKRRGSNVSPLLMGLKGGKGGLVVKTEG